MMWANNVPPISEIEKEVRMALTDNFNRIIHGRPLHKDGDFRNARKQLQKKGIFAISRG